MGFPSHSVCGFKAEGESEMRGAQVEWSRGRVGVAVLLVLAFGMLLVATLGLTGCSGSKTSASSAAAEVSASADSKAYIGTWDFTSMTFKGQTFTKKQLDNGRKQGLEFFVNINEDGTWLLCLGNENNVAKGTWSEGGDGRLVLTSGDGSTGEFVIDGDTALCFGQPIKKSGDVKVPPKAQEASANQAASSAEAESEQAEEPESAPAEEPVAESGEVSPDVKEALDSYEQVMDEYVAFMKQYKESGNAVSMLSDYTAMLQKYTEFSSKIESMDTKNMSKADYAYYIEVTSRVSQKLLEAM